MEDVTNVDKLERNAEYYPDPTAFQAMANIESKDRARELIRAILTLCRESDFELVERIQIYDRRTGRVYK